MHFPQAIYGWLVSIGIISNTGQQDERGEVTLPQSVASGFDSGYLLGEIIRRLSVQGGKKMPSALGNVKPDSSKNARLTNWNFIWLAFEAIGLKLDGRIKELILQGEQALIVEVIRQLYEKDQQRDASAKITVRMKSSSRAKGHTQAVDIKKINLSKDPQESQSSLQFLMLLLKASLGMSLEEILGLFTNQNKYLAHIIVKGLNENFSPIVLFYSLLNKHAKKLRDFYEQDSRDAQACLLALKPGFISKSEQVSQLTIELFGKLGNIYGWFISEQSKCSSTLLLGLKRHHSLRQGYWSLLTQLIQQQQIQYFSMCYKDSFQNQQQLVQITTLIIRFISQSSFCEKLVDLGVVSSWLEIAMKLPESSIEAQIECFRFIGEIMLHIPDIVDKTEECLAIFERKWYEKTLPQFSNLFNELIVILEKLGEGRSSLARKVYMAIASIAKKVGPGDKRDYLVENFLPLIAKFPTIPSQYLIQHLRRSPLSSSQFLLICQSIEINQDVETLVAVGNFLKSLLLQNPLLNFYTGALLKEIVQKSMKQVDVGIPFFQKLLEDTLFLFGNLQIKYKSKPKQQQSLYFGKKGSPDKVSRQDEEQSYIKQRWKSVTLGLIMSLLDLAFSEQNQQMKDLIREKLLNANAKIKLNNHKIGSKGIEQILYKRFGISKEEQVEHSEEFSKKQSANLEQSRLNRSKAQSYASVTSKLKGPDSLVREFEKIAEKRRQEEEERRALELKKQVVEEKKKLSVKKELQIMNLLRGQVGEAQIREMGFLQRLVQQTKELEVIPMEQLESREIEAIESILKKYHRVLRHLFLTYTWTMYNSHSTERFEDNQQRKQSLNVVELGKMLKDYKLSFLTSQGELIGLVRDINIKLLNKREVNQIDFQGFQQFIVQFCGLIMTRKHTITTTTSQGQSFSSKNYRDLPLRDVVSQFFVYLKNVFIARGEKISVFEDVSDIPLTKQQQYQVDILTKKLQRQPNYILPQGYKKVSYNTVEFSHMISNNIQGISEAYLVALSVIDDILAKQPLGSHTIEDLSEKKTVYRVKPSMIGEITKQRALSTYIQRKFPAEIDMRAKRSSSKGIIAGLNQIAASQKNIAKQAAESLLKIVDKVSTSLQKQKQKQKKLKSVAKLQELQSSKLEHVQKKNKQKQQQRLAQLKKQKQQEKKRREQTQRFLQQQKIKLQQKKKKEQELKQKKLRQEQQKQMQKKENKQKFKSFHQGQLQKIKKISQEVLQKQRKQKQQEQQQKQRHQQLKKQLREKIEEQDKRIVQMRKQSQKNIHTLFQSEPIRRVFTRFDSNLKALFDFLIHNTFLSITEKKHNNEIIYEAWRQFITVFDLSFIILPKDTAFIFKVLTKHKLVTKEYFIGLSFGQFQQALLRIAIKYQTIFNKIAERIKDNIEPPQKSDPNAENKGKDSKQGKKGKKSEKKQQKAKQAKQQQQQNEFDSSKQINIKQLIKETTNNKDLQDYGDISKVNDRTLLGLIYYLRVPNTKVGQQKRFRDILANKNSAFAHTAQRLKQKLSQQYTLESPTKKTNPQKPVQNGSISQKSIK